MGLPSLPALFVGVVIVVSLLGVGLVRKYRPSITGYHAPALLLVLLGVSVGLTAMIAVGAASIPGDADRIDYHVERCGAEFGFQPDSSRQVRQFQELSPEAKDVFLAAKRTEGEYSTSRSPSDLKYVSDHTSSESVNFVQHESECYVLVAETGGSWGAGLAAAILFAVGVGGALLLVVPAVVSLAVGSFKLPTAYLVGLVAFVAAWRTPGPGSLRTWALAFAVVVLTWVLLRIVETRSSTSFNERMKT